MKNASKHAETLKALLKKIAKEKPDRPEMDPIVAIARGALSIDADDILVDEAMAKIEAEFVDLNELRVATELEVQDMIGESHPKIDEKSMIIRSTMHAIFDTEQTLNLTRYKELKKADIRQALKDLGTLPAFTEAFIALHSFDVSAFPVDQTILDYLIDQEVVEEDSTIEQTQTFLESYIKADDIYGAYLAVREKALQHESKKPKKDKKK